MAGGPSTPELAAAVANAGGLGFVAAGYRSAGQLRADIEAARALSDGPIGVNLFLVSEALVDDAAIAAYARELGRVAARYGTELGRPRFDDDDLEAKLKLVRDMRVPIVSFTFGCPTPQLVRELQGMGSRSGSRSPRPARRQRRRWPVPMRSSARASRPAAIGAPSLTSMAGARWDCSLCCDSPAP